MRFSDFGTRLSELRNECQMTQGELADALNVTNQTVIKWENGTAFPDVHKLPQIAHVLETTTDYLFGCVRKQHKVFCCNVDEGDGSPAKGGTYRRRYETELNDKYLAQGWRIVNTALSGANGMTYMMVILERDD